MSSREIEFLLSRGITATDVLIDELLNCERSNRARLIFTLISIYRKTEKFKISGIIDFEDSLRKFISNQNTGINWIEVFQMKRMLIPTKKDLR